MNSSPNFEHGKETFNRLLKKSDFYDNYLIKNFGAKLINKDE